ncbi:sensor histidine kinase [Sphingomonas oligoaromativorans]|uniref:sensor histidine kinase n=1 Tax=Sphingomonas oligoaromativorans TaxID=575322 RepID=UPI001423D186|nr:ATP-binding protein [Sphingomonas oligoaromativorans]NIJ33320.1 signal transduction histidine kinase [Sphingomonas oligoaromativorans]
MLSEGLRFRDIRNTSTFRLTLLLGLVAAIGVVALLGLIYGLSARELDSRSDRILRAEAARLEGIRRDQLPDHIRVAIRRSVSGLNYYGLLDREGRPLAGNLRGSSGFVPGHVREIAGRSGRHGPVRLLAVRTAAGETILIGRDITPLVDLRRRVFEVLAFSGVAIALLILIAGTLLSFAPLRRLGRLQRSAHKIAAGHLEERMPILGRGDELDLFAGTVNTMVDEVGRVVSQVKAVTDAVAHDLRTPLTRVRAQLYRAGQQPDISPLLAGKVDAALADLDMVLERFAALLRISELETGSRRAGFHTVDLAALARAAIDLYGPLAEERGIALTLEAADGARMFGDDKLLFEAVGNLIDNAIKFAPAGGRVGIRVRSAGDGVRIEIRDNGPGIPADQRKAVLRRFHRGAGSEGVEGSGLGLSVVAAIAHLHQLSLDFDDAKPGLIARLHSPGR